MKIEMATEGRDNKDDELYPFGEHNRRTASTGARTEPREMDRDKEHVGKELRSVKVDVSVLGSACATRYAITTETSVEKLVSTVLTKNAVLCSNPGLCRLTLEQFGYCGDAATAGSPIDVSDNTKPIYVKRLYTGGKCRFRLTLVADARLVVVYDRSNHANITSLKPPQLRAIITTTTSCQEVVAMMTRDRIGTRRSSKMVSLFEVEVASEDVGTMRRLQPEQLLLAVQEKHFGRHDVCLQLREVAVTDDWLTQSALYTVRRVQSLTDLGVCRTSTAGNTQSCRPPGTSTRKDVRAASATRCTSDKQRDAIASEADQHDSSHQEFSTLSKLKDNVSKLRAHLMGVRYPRRLPVGTMSDTSGDEAHYKRTRNLVMTTAIGASKDCTNYRSCNGYNSEGEHSDNDSVKCNTRRHVINQSGHGDGPVKVGQQPRSYVGRRRTYYRAHARNAGSEEPHHVRMNHLQKSQSLMELKSSTTPPVHTRRRPVRTKSASSTRSASSQPAALSDDGSDDGQQNETDTTSRTRRSLDAGLDSSSWPSAFSRSSSSVSVSSSRSKGKRTLPKVPSVGGSELEERKKRISNQVLKRAQRKVLSLAEKHLSPEVSERQRMRGGGNHNTGGNNCSKQDDRHRHCNTAGDVYCNEVRYTNSSGSHNVNRSAEYDAYVPDCQRLDEYPVHTVDVANLTTVCSDDSDDETVGRGRPPQQLRRVNGLLQLHLQQDGYTEDKGYVCDTPTDKNGYCQSLSRQRLGERTSSSADALQRIIRDLRDASTKPIEQRRVSCNVESTDEFSSSASPSSSSSSSERHVVDDQLFTPISQQQAVVDDNDNIADGIGRYLEISQSITTSLQKRKLHGMSAQDGGNDVNVRNEVNLSHPSLHRIVKSCDLITVTLANKRGHDVGEYGIELFESAYCDTCPEAKRTSSAEDSASFRSPEGRRPVIGRTRGAFMPVSSTADGGGGGVIMSLVAIDRIVHSSIARCSGSLREGDYVIEVNGAYVVLSPIDEVRRHLSRNQDTLKLVIARSRLTQSLANPVAGKLQHLQNKEDVNVDVRKELEKMKLKYTTLRQTTEKNMDMIAELQLELKEKQARIRQLEEELREKQEQAHVHEQQHAATDEKIMHWRRETNQRSVEIARLKFDARQKEDRIAQLRKLLIQQTELMHLQGFNSGSVSDAEYEEHISEV